MENQYFVDSKFLPPKALERKHRLENDPSSRRSHMEYLDGMEKIDSDICEKVMAQMESYQYSRYTAADVKAALEHEHCSVEDFKALLSPAAEPFWNGWRRRRGSRHRSISATRYTCLRRCILPITVRITAYTAALTAITILTV